MRQMLSPAALSRHRQSIQKLVKRIEFLSSRCLFSDPLIHGSPVRVFRKCGKKSCKCAADDTQRHGPYPVIQVVRNGRSRQICLRKDQAELFEQAQHYQHQMQKLAELKTTCQALIDLVRAIIDQRVKVFPP